MIEGITSANMDECEKIESLQEKYRAIYKEIERKDIIIEGINRKAPDTILELEDALGRMEEACEQEPLLVGEFTK